MLSMWLACHTQEDIAEAVGMQQGHVAEFLQKISDSFREKDSDIFRDFLDEPKDGEKSPRLEWWEGEDPIAYVLSENLHRRHLDESQRAMVHARLATMRAEKGRPSDKSTNLPTLSQSEASRLLNVSERSGRYARRVLEQAAPELVKAVDAGKVAVSAAMPLLFCPSARGGASCRPCLPTPSTSEFPKLIPNPRVWH